MANLRILLLDSELNALVGLRNLIATESDFTIVGEAGDWWTAVGLAGNGNVDVCILDVSRPDLDGVVATRRLKQAHPGIKVIVLAVDHDLPALEPLLGSGINAYILQRRVGAELVPAIRAVMKTGVYLSDSRHPRRNEESPLRAEQRR